MDYKAKEGIGSEGPPGKEIIYTAPHGTFELSENKVVFINISTTRLSAHFIEYLKDWADFAYKGLTQKYGNYAHKLLSIDEVNILSFKPGEDVGLYLWRIGDSVITLSMGSTYYRGHYYYSSISFRDYKAFQKERQRSKTKSEL